MGVQLRVASAGSDVDEGGADKALRRFKPRATVATAHECGVSLEVAERLGNRALMSRQHLCRRSGITEQADKADALRGGEREVEAGPALAEAARHKAPAISRRPAVQHCS